MQCLYCDNEPWTVNGKPITTLPMCPKHLDLVLLINYLSRRDQEINTANIQALLETGLPLNIKVNEVDDLLASYLKVKTQV